MRNRWRAPSWIALAIAAALGAGCTGTGAGRPDAASIVEVVEQGRSDLFPVPLERYRDLEAQRPIGVFDSGIGGLTVLEAIVTIDRFDNRTHAPGADGRPDFENESFVYLGDQANMPYGNYPSENRVDFLKELILKDVVFLLGDRYWPSQSATAPRRDKPPVKAIVIACNTATAYGLEDVHAALERWRVPVFTVGVVAAGADGAVESLRESETSGAVAVMATVGTCRSEGYVREIVRSSQAAGIEAPQVIQQGSVGLAGAIEGSPEFIVPPAAADAAAYRGPAVGNPEAPIDPSLAAEYGFDPEGLLGDREDPATWRLNSVGNYIRYDTTSLVESHRRSGSTEAIRTVILGCTHYPFYQEEIEASFERLRGLRTPEGDAPYRDLIADEIVFIDPAELTAVQLYEALSERKLFAAGSGEGATADEFYISVPNPSCAEVELRPDGLGFTYDYKYGRVPGRLDREDARRVPMSRDSLDDGVIETIRTSMPAVWNRLARFGSRSPRCADLPAEVRIGATR